ncbi:MAG: T9SS type A sorting domain-containing protein, partial [Flavobacteriales bacterium]
TEWFSGTCGSLTNIVCNNGLATGLIAGQDYYIRNYTTSTTAMIAERTVVDVYMPASNDECTNALSLPVTGLNEATQPREMSTLLATSSVVPCGTNVADVWFTFEAPTTGVSVQSDLLQRYTLYSGTCGSLTCLTTEVSAVDHSFENLTVGTSYFLKVGAISPASLRNDVIRLFAAAENDDCADAVNLPVQPSEIPSEWFLASTFHATQSLPGCSNAGDSDDDIWFSFTATDSVQMLHALSFVVEDQLRFELMAGACGSLTTILCSDLLQDRRRLSGLTTGTTYYVRLYFTGGDRDGLQVAITRGVRNDDCVGAVPLPFSNLQDWNTLAASNTMYATNGIAGCAAQRDVWYTFTAAHTSAAFLLAPGNSYTLELFSGNCGALTSIVCHTSTDRSWFNGLVPGAQYYFRVQYVNTFLLVPMLFDAPVNDDIDGAIALPSTATTFATEARQAWTYGATSSYQEMCGPSMNPDDDVWFRFVATQATHTIYAVNTNLQIKEAPLTPGDMRIEAYMGYSSDSLGLDSTVLGCAATTLPLAGLLVGDTVYFRVYTTAQGLNKVSAFLVNVRSGNNDEASGAQVINYSTNYTLNFNTAGATESLPGADCTVDDFADDDIWFTFIASGQRARIVAGMETADLALELFSGTPGSLISIACSENILELPTNLTTGQAYYARLYSTKNTSPVSGHLGLFISPSITANSCVDEACLGPVLLANPSIEQGATCSPNFTLGDAGLNTFMAPDWLRQHRATCDSYSSCADFNSQENVPAVDGIGILTERRILSRNGEGMAGIYTKGSNAQADYHEYIQAPLTTPLIPGEPYLVSYYVSNLAYNGRVAMNGFGALFTTGELVQTDYRTITLPPQLIDMRVIASEEWVNICGIVVPDEPWDHITIGTFLTYDQYAYLGDGYSNVLSTGYYFIDDVVVAQVSDPSCITTAVEELPNERDSQSTDSDNLRIYPNPANDRVNIVADADLFGERGVIEVFDATGKRVHVEQVSSFMALRSLELSGEWKEGLYLVMVRVEGQAPRSARVVVKR